MSVLWFIRVPETVVGQLHCWICEPGDWSNNWRFDYLCNTLFGITMTSQWARWRLKSPALRLFSQPFIRVQIKENIKAPCHWPLCVSSPVTRKMFPFDDVIMGQSIESVVHGLCCKFECTLLNSDEATTLCQTYCCFFMVAKSRICSVQVFSIYPQAGTKLYEEVSIHPTIRSWIYNFVFFFTFSVLSLFVYHFYGITDS